MEGELNIWERYPAADLPQDQAIEDWTTTELERAFHLSPEEDLDGFVSAGVGLLKALRAAGRSDLIMKACEEDPDLMLTCIDGFSKQFPLTPEELGSLLTHVTYPHWITTLLNQYSQRIARWTAEERQHLPESIRERFDDPLHNWLIRHHFPESVLALAQKLLRYGLPLETLSIWRLAHLSFADQEKALDRLERATPGMAAQLYERFNILNFARYPFSHLQDQHKADLEGAPSFGWVFFSSGDNSGALKRSTRFLSSASIQPGTWLFELHDVQATWPKVERILAERGKGHFLVFHAHANSEGFELLPRSSRLVRKDLGPLAVGSSLGALLYPNAPILLGGCGAGQEGGIAEDIASFGFDVYASEAPASSARFSVDPHGVPTVSHSTKIPDRVSPQPCTRFLPGFRSR